MIDEKLMRRISNALSSPRGIGGDPELRSILEQNPQAAAYADELGKLGALVNGWSIREPSAPDFESLAQVIESRLDQSASLLGDFTQVPRFDDPYANAPPDAGDFSVGNLGALEVAPSGPPSKRPSLPPLPQPTGERAMLPEVAPVPLQRDFRIPSVPPGVEVADEDVGDRETPKKARTWWPMAAAAVALLAAGGVFVALQSGSKEEITDTSRAAESAPPPMVEVSAEAPKDEKSKDDLADEEGDDKSAEGKKSAGEEKLAAASKDEPESTSSRRSRGKHGKKESASKPSAKASPKTAATSGLPDTPSKPDVLTAMKPITPRVMACQKGRHGVLLMKISVAGSSGKVTSATPTGSFAGSPEGDCAGRAVRGAKFPRFKKDSFSFNYPFRL